MNNNPKANNPAALLRLLFDFQLLTIVRDARKTLPSMKGPVLDIGAGSSPYRYLLDATRTTYKGIDVAEASDFDYKNPDITFFDGRDIPFEDGSFDAVICTEVLEHVENYQELIDEMRRVMRPGAIGFITIPWSARFHYIPHDYFRYTPSSLKKMFSSFSQVEIKPRGSDVAVIANKLIVLWFRNLTSLSFPQILFWPVWLLCIPLLILYVFIAHLSLLISWGSQDDPLGYTVLIKK